LHRGRQTLCIFGFLALQQERGEEEEVLGSSKTQKNKKNKNTQCFLASQTQNTKKNKNTQRFLAPRAPNTVYVWFSCFATKRRERKGETGGEGRIVLDYYCIILYS